MEPLWIIALILLGIVILSVAFAFWLFPTKGTGQWWKELHWDSRNENRYD